jgi:hypothetical protein
VRPGAEVFAQRLGDEVLHLPVLRDADEMHAEPASLGRTS